MRWPPTRRGRREGKWSGMSSLLCLFMFETAKVVFYNSLLLITFVDIASCHSFILLSLSLILRFLRCRPSPREQCPRTNSNRIQYVFFLLYRASRTPIRDLKLHVICTTRKLCDVFRSLFLGNYNGKKLK